MTGAGEEGGECLVPLPEKVPPYSGEDYHRRFVHEGLSCSPRARPSGRGHQKGGAWSLYRRGGRGRRGAGSLWLSPADGHLHASATLPRKERGRPCGSGEKDAPVSGRHFRRGTPRERRTGSVV